jgi:hypothetical protein
MAEANRVFWVLGRSGTFRQNSVVLPSRVVETILAPPSIRIVVSARDVPQTCISVEKLTGGTGLSTGGSSVPEYLTAGVPKNGLNTVPSLVYTTSTFTSPSAKLQAFTLLKTASPGPLIANRLGLETVCPSWSVRVTRKLSDPTASAPNWTSPPTSEQVAALITLNHCCPVNN